MLIKHVVNLWNLTGSPSGPACIRSNTTPQASGLYGVKMKSRDYWKMSKYINYASSSFYSFPMFMLPWIRSIKQVTVWFLHSRSISHIGTWSAGRCSQDNLFRLAQLKAVIYHECIASQMAVWLHQPTRVEVQWPLRLCETSVYGRLWISAVWSKDMAGHVDFTKTTPAFFFLLVAAPWKRPFHI